MASSHLAQTRRVDGVDVDIGARYLHVCVITDAGLMLARGRRASLANTHLTALLFYMDGVHAPHVVVRGLGRGPGTRPLLTLTR